ncbi:uncharacterized protein LOC128722176 [Anopheles nili]|uniref:uncharacterized protein LOC128722176 n=1 Tax=Anopheles nili TaxID=185578 RepID=UPI00237A5F61|nr:uncharacterized protein LOC128722176 [Anopheles nili]
MRRSSSQITPHFTPQPVTHYLENILYSSKLRQRPNWGNSSHQTTPWSVAVGRECSAFKTLIISNKRIAPAISEFGLKKLKYPNLSSAQEPKPPQRISATANSRKSDDVPVHRPSIIEQKSTKFKPAAVPPDPIIEVPESPVAREVPLPVVPESDTVNDASRNCNLPLPLIAIEEEDVEKENVNDFISNSQSSGTEQSSKLRQKNPPLNQLPKVLTKSKPVAREAPIPGVVPFKDTIYSASKNCTPSLPLIAIEEEDVEKENVYDFISNSQSSDMEQPSKLKQKKNPKKKQPKGSVKPKPKQQKHAIGNPFGCSGVRLKHLIKKIGGGPVKPPAVVDYVINLEIPNTPPKPTAAVTSNLAENANRPSPWRVQDDTIIPRTSYAPRNKQMLPSYESFSVEPSGTERGKSLPQSASIEDLELATSQTTPSVAGEDAIITDSDFRQVEKMYNELKAVSDMSEKLITAMRKHKTSSNAKQRDRRVYETSMHQACQKLKKWYDHSMKSFNHSIRIIQNIERVTNRSVGPSPLTLEQQRTVEKFNQSSDHFRLMVDELQAAVNDSDRRPRSSSKGTEKEPNPKICPKPVIDVVPGRKRSMNDSDRENRPPAVAPSATQTMVRSGTGYITTMAHKSNTASAKTPADVVLLPDRGKGATRNPLIALNFVPLAQHDSPLMSPLAKEPVLVATSVNREKRFVPRELLYDKENESIVPKDPLCDKANESILAIDSHVETRSPPGAVEVAPQKRVEKSPESSVVELNDETMNAPKNKSISKDNETLCENDTSNDDYFGFDSQEYVESSLPQITLPNPLNISSDTLHQRLDNVRKLLPKQPLLRHRPVTRPRNSGPTRLPLRMPRVFTSPTKRPYTLPEFVASTPRPETVGAPGGSSAGGGEVDTVAVPDVSAIGQTMTEDDPPAVDQPEVVLFDTPDAPKWKSNSVLHRTYARVPRRRKKNIYLLNLGLDDDDDEEVDDDAGNASDDSQNQWSDAEGIAAKRKKKKKKNKPRRPPVPVEQTEEFQNFVESFNSMCDEVDRYDMIIE